MRSIITSERFDRLDHPRKIDALIYRQHRMAKLLLAMCYNHPRIYSRDELMAIGGFTSAACGGPICAITSFHFWMLRINDTLPRTGWRVNDASGYRLTPITLAQEAELRHRLNTPVKVSA